MVYFAERLGIQPVHTLAAAALLQHQSGLAKNPQVLGNRGTADGESLRDVAGRQVACGQSVQDGAPGGVGDGGENRNIPRCEVDSLLEHNM
jgi:hypothetical protein